MKETLITVTIAVALTAALLGAAVHRFGWGGVQPVTGEPEVPYAPVPEADRFHGVALQIHDTKDMEAYFKAIDEIAQAGADTVLLSTAAYQENGASSKINIDMRRAPTREQMIALIRHVRGHNMRVIVMPILLLSNPRGNEWRGKIVPADPIRWWAEYREFIRFYADAADDGGADVLLVGSELNRMEQSTTRWRDLIAYCRKNWPGLKLGYSSNWDRYMKVGFWDALDYAGVTTYYTLGHHDEPTVDEIVAEWQQHAAALRRWHGKTGKPIIFTEVGWYSRKGAAQEPWNYYRDSEVSMVEQRNLYEAFLRVWSEPQPEKAAPTEVRGFPDIVGGIVFWEWTIYPGGENDGSYTPQGKPACDVMKNYFARFANRPMPATDEHGR